MTSTNSQRQTAQTRGWRKRLDETYAVVAAIERSTTPEEVGRALLVYVGRYGVDHTLAGTMPPIAATRREQLSHVLLDEWPPEWSRRYFGSGYLFHDPAIRMVRDGATPFRWRDYGATAGRDPHGRNVMREATDFGLADGVTISFQSPEGGRIGISFAGARLDLETGHYDVLRLISAFAIGRCISIIERRPDVLPVTLTSRQRDVLSWAAEGLSKRAIGDRLAISAHTVDTHLRSVRLQLGVTTTINAVAEAFRRGLID